MLSEEGLCFQGQQNYGVIINHPNHKDHTDLSHDSTSPQPKWPEDINFTSWKRRCSGKMMDSKYQATTCSCFAVFIFVAWKHQIYRIHVSRCQSQICLDWILRFLLNPIVASHITIPSHIMSYYGLLICAPQPDSGCHPQGPVRSSAAVWTAHASVVDCFAPTCAGAECAPAKAGQQISTFKWFKCIQPVSNILNRATISTQPIN